MALTKVTFPGLELYVDVLDINYIEKEIPVSTTLIMAQEKQYFTRVSFKNGKTIMCQESPEWILKKIEDQSGGDFLKKFGIDTGSEVDEAE